MAVATYVPRINNNDDEVKLVGLQIAAKDRVIKGQVIAQVETDKAVVDVESAGEGFVLAINGAIEDSVRVGSVLCWIGATADEAVPLAAQLATGPAAAAGKSAAPTAKAAALLAQHGLDANQVPASGDRLSVADVESFIATRGGAPMPAREWGATAAGSREMVPDVAGELKVLKSDERGMLATVTWHRDTAVPGYIEIPYDPTPWDAFAQSFGKDNGLLLSPLLPLMAWRLVELATELPRLNATIVGSKRYEYSEVNLGFTVQAGDVLYLAVVRDGAALSPLGFVNALVDLQRRAAVHKLGPKEIQGTTIGFSSMARWKVARHIPILPPLTALMVAHAVSPDGNGVLGATYDHRVLNGAEVANVLRKLSNPPKSLELSLKGLTLHEPRT